MSVKNRWCKHPTRLARVNVTSRNWGCSWTANACHGKDDRRAWALKTLFFSGFLSMVLLRMQLAWTHLHLTPPPHAVKPTFSGVNLLRPQRKLFTSSVTLLQLIPFCNPLLLCIYSTHWSSWRGKAAHILGLGRREGGKKSWGTLLWCCKKKKSFWDDDNICFTSVQM